MIGLIPKEGRRKLAGTWKGLQHNTNGVLHNEVIIEKKTGIGKIPFGCKRVKLK